jgi:hypothetical protein
LNHKIVTVTILFFVACALVLAPIEPLVKGMDLNILQVTPNSKSAAMGTSCNLLGTIYTSNGSFQVFIGKTLVASGTADGYYVDTNFTVPELPAATYALILRDTKINVNASDQFTVNIGYSVTASPSTIQEGNTVTVTAAVTGGSLGTSYGAKIVVTSPSGTSYTSTVALGISNVKGTASADITLPGSSFSPAGDTLAAGTYKVTFNSTLASTQFSANILDSTTYHRGQTASIRAAGYEANQAAIITITSVKTGETLDTISTTASAEGIISTSWTVSSNAPIGDCSLKITPSGNQKTVPDQQTFTVAGYSVNIQATNLAGSAVADINVRVTDSVTGTESNAVTNSAGIANFGLEKGPHGVVAYWNDVNIGQTNITVTGDGTFTIRCQLNNLKVTVKTQDGIPMPFVDLAISYRYQSGSISKSGSSTGQTDPSGTYTLTSTVAGATYTIDASLYGQIFSGTNNTFNSYTDQPTAQATIICPSKNITLTIKGYDNQPVQNARVELVELSNGLFYSTTSNSNGVATTQATFGMYRLRIYKDNALVNETTSLQVFNDNQQQIRCTLYGIQLSVSVVDFFGSPISNANVTLNGAVKTSAATEVNGVATFDNLIGGNMQIIAQAQGTQDASQAITVNVNEPTTVQIKLDKYVSIGGILIRASTLITIAIILVIAVLFVVVEVYRRQKAKPAAPSAT